MKKERIKLDELQLLAKQPFIIDRIYDWLLQKPIEPSRPKGERIRISLTQRQATTLERLAREFGCSTDYVANCIVRSMLLGESVRKTGRELTS